MVVALAAVLLLMMEESDDKELVIIVEYVRSIVDVVTFRGTVKHPLGDTTMLSILAVEIDDCALAFPDKDDAFLELSKDPPVYIVNIVDACLYFGVFLQFTFDGYRSIRVLDGVQHRSIQVIRYHHEENLNRKITGTDLFKTSVET